MNREEDHSVSPANIGEINLTLRFMQKTMDGQGALMKEMSGKLDAMNGNIVSQADFSSYKAYVEKTCATKEEVRPLIRIMWFIGGLVGTALVGAGLSLIIIR